MQQLGPHITLWPLYAAFALSVIAGVVGSHLFNYWAGVGIATVVFWPALKISTVVIFRVMIRTKSDKTSR